MNEVESQMQPKLLIFHQRDARFHGEHFFVAWDWARSRLLPEPHCSAQPQKRSATKMRMRIENGITAGDAALLRFPAALEILEADFWIQYNELGGIQDSEVPGGSGIAKPTPTPSSPR